MTREEFLSPLNPPQREAVETVEGPLLVIAGAGSGKTRVITYRVAYLLRFCGAGPWNIFAVTFTNKAAGEMRRRVVDLLGTDPGAGLQVSTFHSACARLLRREGHQIGLSPHFTICDDSDQTAIIKDCMKSLQIEPEEVRPAAILNIISQAKMRMLTAADFAASAETPGEKRAADVFQLYQKRLGENDAVDFDDLINCVVRLFDESPDTLAEYQRRWRYVLVDEYQDTNHAQYRLVEALARQHRNLCVVGDEDQSIYSWRGAEITNLLEFQKHFPEARVIRLEQNYRSTQAVLAVANSFIARNTQRLGKNLWTARAGGHKPVLTVAWDANEEARIAAERIGAHHADGVAYRDMAVFYRANALSRPFEDQLRERNIPYRVIGGIRFYDRAEIKDLLAYLQLIENPSNSIALLRVINRPRRGLGEKSVGLLQRLADQYGLSCYDAILKAGEEKSLPKAACEKMFAFREQIEAWRARRAQRQSISDLYRAVLEDTKYVESLGDPKDFEVVARTENIEELSAAIAEFEQERRSAELGDFLETITLKASVDELGEDDAVSLMTLHCAKGLEYRVVFLAALEEPIFPSALAVEAQGDDEEERRLFYVGVTRAMERLYLSRAQSRHRFGETKYNPESRFLREIPPELLDVDDEDRRSLYARAGQDRSGWGGGLGRPRASARYREFDSPWKGGGARRATGAASPPRHKPVARVSAFDQPAPRGPRSAFHKGQRVRHAVLGEGKIRDIESARGANTLLIIDFDSGETVAMAERIANLKTLDSDA